MKKLTIQISRKQIVIAFFLATTLLLNLIPINAKPFFRREKYITGTSVISPTYIAAGDFNNDMCKDIATISKLSGVTSQQNSIRIYYGNKNISTGLCTGEFDNPGTTLQLQLPTGFTDCASINCHSDSVVTGKFDIDNYDDIAIATVKNGLNRVFVSIFKGSQNGLSTSPTSTHLLTPSSDITTLGHSGMIATGKLDNNRLDIVAGSVGDQAPNITKGISILYDDGNGSFALPTHITGPTNLGFPHSVITGDLNNDSQDDIIVIYKDSGAFLPYLTTSPLMASSAVSTPNNFYGATIGKFIGTSQGTSDSISDVAIVTLSSNTKIFAGLGDGTFNTTNTLTLNRSGLAIESGDLNKDGKDDIVVVNSTASIFLQNANGGFNSEPYKEYTGLGSTEDKFVITDINNDTSPDMVFGGFYKMINTDAITKSNFDGDQSSDIAIWRESNGQWWINKTYDNQTYALQFGSSGDIPVVGDFITGTGTQDLPENADRSKGRSDYGIFRPSNAQWWIQENTSATPSQLFIVTFGLNGDIPVPGDYTDGTNYKGDEKTDIAVWRPSTGTWYVYKSPTSFIAYQFGSNGDKPTQGDYDGDGTYDYAVFRPSNNRWYLQQSTAGYFEIQWGANGDVPVPGDYDGDGKTDIAVWRPSTGTWYVRKSSDETLLFNIHGQNGDTPQPMDYDADEKTDFAVWRSSDATFRILKSTNSMTVIKQFGLSTDKPVSTPYVIQQ